LVLSITTSQKPLRRIYKVIGETGASLERPIIISHVAVGATFFFYSEHKFIQEEEMARKPDGKRLDCIYQTVQKAPGKRPGNIAQLLGLHRSEIIRLLPVLEEYELYLSEDDQGRLWPFKKTMC
jgi:hypothetical protein